jgi:hypothetical protein
MVPAIREAYAAANKNYAGSGSQHWGALDDLKKPIHEALIAGDDETAAILSDPLKTGLFLGFHSWAMDNRQKESVYADWLPGFLYQLLVRLCEATGAIKLWNPEGGTKVQPFRRTRSKAPSLEELLNALDVATGIRIDFPNPFPGEVGLKSSRGVISFRAIHAIYQAWKLRGKKSVVEIGGGMGRTAYYAHLMGCADYTIVDLPTVGVAQGCFLTAALGHGCVQLSGEPDQQPIRLMSPEEFFSEDQEYEAALNVDSLPEMNKDTALKYVRAIESRCKSFLSINGEILWFTVRELMGEPSSRHPYWLRHGYVEELYLC